ncbi:MAG: MotA/TolQ/ExbB proton channel family protein [Sphaerochaetaceae bacterium]
MEITNMIIIMQKGGAVMWPLYALLVITLVLSIERGITLFLIWKRHIKTSKKEVETALSILDLIAIIAPVIGFLGTVTGMINAFKSVAEASSVQLQVIAAGLYEALYTTAFGLIVSILATLSSFLLETVSNTLCEKEEI